MGDFSTSLERTLVAQSVEILHGKRNDKGARGVPLFGRDCRVARRAPRNRLVAKLRREMIGEGFLRVMRVKIAVCSNATNKIF
ncbi:MAG: hypothetical protein LBL66_03420, partial [Clostridiales bacterium]|nr:hypothetical protein [Clostridiales bacterium]